MLFMQLKTAQAWERGQECTILELEASCKSTLSGLLVSHGSHKAVLHLELQPGSLTSMGVAYHNTLYTTKEVRQSCWIFAGVIGSPTF